MSLTLNEARAVSLRAREHAEALGATVTIAIVDAGGHLQILDRMDGANPLSARIAPAKAAGVALFHRDSSDLIGLAEAYPAVFAQIVEVAGTPIVAGRAARLLRRQGVVLGAIAVAGGTLDQDDECVDVGVDAHTLATSTPVSAQASFAE